MKYLLLTTAFLFAASANAANTGLNASSLKVKLYKFAVSTSPLCTNLTTIIDNGTSPSEVDLVGGNGLGSGTISDGTYPCIVIEMSNYIRFTPSANSDIGSCQTSTESIQNICDNGTSTLVDGTSVTCGSSEMAVALHLSTGSSGTTNPWVPPTTVGDTSNGFNLASSLVVSGTAAGKLVVNPTGQVCDYSASGCDGQSTTSASVSSCHLQPPTFSFTQQ